MDGKGILEIEWMRSKVSGGKIYVRGFVDLERLKKLWEELGWEREVWIGDMGEEMIDVNGDKFLGGG